MNPLSFSLIVSTNLPLGFVSVECEKSVRFRLFYRRMIGSELDRLSSCQIKAAEIRTSRLRKSHLPFCA